MFRYLKALVYMVTGQFTKARQTLAENKYVMATTFDKAIDKGNERVKTVKEAVTELAMIEADLIRSIKDMGARIEMLTKARNGAQVAMQNRINALKGSMSKEQIVGDPEFIRHKKAHDDAVAALASTQGEFDRKDADLKKRQGQIASFKAELQSMQRKNESLRTEKQEALADVAIAQQTEAIQATLAGLTTDSTDADLAEAREARNRAKARAQVTADLVGVDASRAQDEYIRLADQKVADSQLDSLLDWGDDKKEELQPAKLAE